jgi:hypothetical protein
MDVEKQQEQDPLHSVTTPRTADGSRIQVTDAQAPGRCFHPTVATIEIEGKKYLWNARAHRKLRYPTSKDRRDHPEKARHRIHLLSFEPHIVSWYICWTGFVANSLWVVNGLYATWPEAASSGEVAELTIYGTGVAGAFLFIIGGYLLYVEAINQNYSKVILPTTEATTRHVSHPSPSNIYGQGQHPLLNLSDQVEEEHLAQMGYPVVQDVPTKLFVTEPLCHRIAQQRAAESEQDNGSPTFTLQGRKLDILIGRHAIRTTVDSIYIRKEKGVSVDDDDKVPNESKEKKKEKSAYIWWSWSPDFRHISILNALIYFIATVLFFIPATVWLPMDRHGNASVASTVFWVQVMQVRAPGIVNVCVRVCEFIMLTTCTAPVPVIIVRFIAVLLSYPDHSLHWFHLHGTCLHGGGSWLLVETGFQQRWLVDMPPQHGRQLRIHGVRHSCHPQHHGP